MTTCFVPPQRNFDGSPLRQARQAQLQQAQDTNPDSWYWADRATRAARQCKDLLPDPLYEDLMRNYSDAWFENRSWRAQADAFTRLLNVLTDKPGAPMNELVIAFGVPDVTQH